LMEVMQLTELKVTFLGTAGSIPTPNRALPAVAVQRKDELLLFDCGEGTQRQMIQAGVGFHRKTKVFVTHMHGDHLLGLPGLMQTMSLMDRKKTLEIYGPEGIREFVESVGRTVRYTLTFPVKVSEVTEGVVCEEKEYVVQAAGTDHMDASLAYALVEKPRPGRFNVEKVRKLGVPEGPLWSRLQDGYAVELPDGRTVKPEMVLGSPRPGRKIVYSGDTRQTEKLVELASGADLLIHEATFSDELAERALEDGHSTPSMAAETAKRARVKQLFLTHISARYRDAGPLLEQARKIFAATELAEDFLTVELPLAES